MAHHTSIQYDGVVHAKTVGPDRYVRCGHLVEDCDISRPVSQDDMPPEAYAVDLHRVDVGVSVCLDCYPRRIGAEE